MRLSSLCLLTERTSSRVTLGRRRRGYDDGNMTSSIFYPCQSLIDDGVSANCCDRSSTVFALISHFHLLHGIFVKNRKKLKKLKKLRKTYSQNFENCLIFLV